MLASTGDLPLRLARVSRRQLGLFTQGQVLRLGFSRPFVRRRLDAGDWEEMHPRVLRVAASAPPSAEQVLMGWVLHTGGVAAGRSAAALFRLAAHPSRPAVLLHRATRSRRHGAGDVRTTSALPSEDVTRVGPVPVTTVARTLVDLGAELPPKEFEELVDRAVLLHRVRPEHLEMRARELWTPRRPGCARTLEVVRSRHPDLAAARSEWEAKVLTLARRHGLPDPVPNLEVVVGGRRRFVDVAWPGVKVGVEFDGYVWHATRRAFDDDRSRQNDFVATGWRLFRLTSTALTRDAAGAFAPVVRAVLAP